jgi:hypothetical protein
VPVEVSYFIVAFEIKMPLSDAQEGIRRGWKVRIIAVRRKLHNISELSIHPSCAFHPVATAGPKKKRSTAASLSLGTGTPLLLV